LAARAGHRWLHYLRDHPPVLRKVVNRALTDHIWLRDSSGRPDRLDRVLLVEGVGRAYEFLTGRPLGRGVTSETKSRQGEVPKGPGFELVKLCLKPLEPDITDHAIDWAIRCVQARARPGNAPTVGASF
jgi:hypothetical protein